MESAYRVIDPNRPELGPRESISIWTYQKAGPDQDRMRSWHFICERCGCRMFPSFPREEKAGRRASPRPYFRAGGSDPHRAGCASPPNGSDPVGGASGDAEARPKRLAAPAVFLDVDRNTDSRSTSPLTPMVDRIEGDDSRSQRRRRTGNGTSISRTSAVRSLAACWHRDRGSVLDLPLTVPGCPGRSYGDVFQRVDAEFGLRLHASGDRFVFWSDAAVILPSAAGDGYLIRFRAKTRKNKWLMAAVSQALMDEASGSELRSRLEAAAEGRDATVYLLGGFRYDAATDCFLLRPVSWRHIWIEPGSPS